MAGENGCEDGHFNLAMKRRSPGSESGLCYYVDPSPFFNRMQPVPVWTEECRDFNFKHIGQVVDFSNLTQSFSVIIEELKRIALEAGRELILKEIDKLPDTGFIGAMKGIAGEIVEDLDLDPANLKNLFKGGSG